METLGDIEQVQQGEEWNLDKLLSASDKEYIPYLISSLLEHPFFVVTVASTRFEKNLRYVKSWWNDITSGETLRFFNTEIVYVGEQYYIDPDDPSKGLVPMPTKPGVGLFSRQDEDNQAPNVGFTNGDNDNYAIGDRNIPTNSLYQFTRADEEIDPRLGHKPYHYLYFVYDGLETEGSKQVWQVSTSVPPQVDNYHCHVRFNFTTDITQHWGGQNYLYQITLVEGRLIGDVLEAIHADHPDAPNWPDTIMEQFDYVKANWPKALQPDIDKPENNNNDTLGSIDLAIPILRPSKLEVFNNTRTII